MNREIKFRGKRVDNGEWVYGGFFTNSEEDGLVTYIFSVIGGAVPVISESVGQFTGLLDYNRKEIYEGDILKKAIGIMNPQKYLIGYVEWYKIEWRTQRKIYQCCGKCDCKHTSPTKRNISDFYKSEIIGNIYENPELLK